MRGGRCRGWAVAAGAVLAALGAGSGCGGEGGATATTATAPVAAAQSNHASPSVPVVGTGGPGPRAAVKTPGGTATTKPRRLARGRALAGTYDDQERALEVLFDELDLPAGWRAEGRATNGLSAIEPRRGTRPVDLGCFAGDRRRKVAAVARTAALLRRADRIDGNVIVYADEDDARGAIAFLRGPAFGACLATRLRSEVAAGRGGRAVGAVRGSIADRTPSGDDGAALSHEIDVERDGRRETVVADVVFVRAGPAIASLQLSSAGGAGDLALRDELSAELARRLRASYG